MAKVILKKTPIHCAVLCSAASTETITLATDLFIAERETITTPKVIISGLTWSVPAGNASIVRGGVTLWLLTYADVFRFDTGWYDNRNLTDNIVVTFPGGGGTVVIEFMKVEGYGDSEHRNQDI